MNCPCSFSSAFNRASNDTFLLVDFTGPANFADIGTVRTPRAVGPRAVHPANVGHDAGSAEHGDYADDADYAHPVACAKMCVMPMTTMYYLCVMTTPMMS